MENYKFLCTIRINNYLIQHTIVLKQTFSFYLDIILLKV